MKYIKPIVFIIACLLLIKAGGYVFQGFLTGIMLLLGFVFLSESIKPLRWLVYKLIRVIDIAAFVLGIYALFAFTLTMAIGLGVVGLGITLAYRPYVQMKLSKTT